MGTLKNNFMSPGGYTRAHLEVGIMWVCGSGLAKFSNVDEASTEAKLASERCTAVYTEYLELFSLAKIIFMTHSVSTCLAELVAHSG